MLSVCYCHCLLSKSAFCLFREWMKLCLLVPHICLFARVWVKTGWISWHFQSFYSNCTKNKSNIFVRKKKYFKKFNFFSCTNFFFQDTLQKFWWLSTRITAKMDCFLAQTKPKFNSLRKPNTTVSFSKRRSFFFSSLYFSHLERETKLKATYFLVKEEDRGNLHFFVRML